MPWNSALTSSELTEKLLQSLGLNGVSPSPEYNASVVALSQAANVLRRGGLFDVTPTIIALVLLAVAALVMFVFFATLHFKRKSLRLSSDVLLLLGALCTASSLFSVSGSFFALSRGQGMLTLVPPLAVESGREIFVGPGDFVLGVTRAVVGLAVVFAVLIGYMAFERSGKDRSKGSKAKTDKKQDEPKGNSNLGGIGGLPIPTIVFNNTNSHNYHKR
jgi:hypothetical protein